MELKLYYNNASFFDLLSSNRTFMELKCQMLNRHHVQSTVLIAPLWN